MGLKASDQYVAFLCYSCHTELDQGKSLNKQQRRDMWQVAYERTQALMGRADADN